LEGKSENIEGAAQDQTGAMLAWNTGIAEVALPIEFKLKNIEDTERARTKLMEDKQSRRQVAASGGAVVGSYSSTTLALGNATTAYLKQQQEYQQEMRRNSQHHIHDNSGDGAHHAPAVAVPGCQSDASAPRADRPRGVEFSTDDMVLDRFKKRQRRTNR